MKKEFISGVYELNKLPTNTYFRVIGKNGVSNRVYIKGKNDYCREDKKYYCSNSDDISSSRKFRRNQKVTTEFRY